MPTSRSGQGPSASLEKRDTRIAGPVFILSEACDLHDRPLAMELWLTDPPASTANAGITGVSHYLQISQVLCASSSLFHSLRAYLVERGGCHAPKQVVDRETVPTQLQVWHSCLEDGAKAGARAEALEL